MMIQTNLVIVPAQHMYNPMTPATQVDICDYCGGLFARPGNTFMGIVHAH